MINFGLKKALRRLSLCGEPYFISPKKYQS